MIRALCAQQNIVNVLGPGGAGGKSSFAPLLQLSPKSTLLLAAICRHPMPVLVSIFSADHSGKSRARSARGDGPFW